MAVRYIRSVAPDEVLVSVREHIESAESVVIQEWWPDSIGGHQMWTNENRARYDRSKLRYPSDLTDDEWALVAALIPPAKPGGNKRSVDIREVVGSTTTSFGAASIDLSGRATITTGAIPAGLRAGRYPKRTRVTNFTVCSRGDGRALYNE